MRTAIAICTYNGLPYLEEQLDSIRLQTVKPDLVIIRDDGSTDGTAQLVRDYIDRHGLCDSWDFAVNAKNLGFAENFHHAALACRDACDLIFFCDQDDVWKRDKIEACLEVMGGHLEVDVLCHEYDIIDGKGKVSPVTGQAAPLISGDGTLERIFAHNGGVYIWLGWAMVARSSYLGRIEEYRFEGWAHDEWVWKCAQATGSLYVLHRSFGSHRVHGGNATGHKVHARTRRIAECRMKMLGDREALRLARSSAAPRRVQKVFERAVRCGEMRLELLEERRFVNAFKLLCYLDAYQAKRSWFSEIAIALKSK